MSWDSGLCQHDIFLGAFTDTARKCFWVLPAGITLNTPNLFCYTTPNDFNFFKSWGIHRIKYIHLMCTPWLIFTYVYTCITTSKSRHRVFPPPKGSLILFPSQFSLRKANTILFQLPCISCAALKFYVNGKNGEYTVFFMLCFTLNDCEIQPFCK